MLRPFSMGWRSSCMLSIANFNMLQIRQNCNCQGPGRSLSAGSPTLIMHSGTSPFLQLHFAVGRSHVKGVWLEMLWYALVLCYAMVPGCSLPNISLTQWPSQKWSACQHMYTPRPRPPGNFLIQLHLHKYISTHPVRGQLYKGLDL